MEEQVALGPRAPGTAAHERLADMLAARAAAAGAEVTVQEFPLPFRGRTLRCRNVVGVFRARGKARGSPLLLGSHYDTRWRADRDPDPARREQPIPGANDGGSGTAVLLHMLPRLARGDMGRDTAVAFLDVEDLGDIDGKRFAMGAEWLAAHPAGGFMPAEVVVLDMVGGAGMVLDIDAHVLSQPSSRALTTRLFSAGAAAGWEPFAGDKPGRVKYVISDHSPFAAAGLPACLLIDIDYPEWHTQADLPAAMSAASLGITEAALWLSLPPRRA